MVTPDENSLGSTNHSRYGAGQRRQPAITLASAVAVRVEHMGRQLGGLDASEVIRRGLILLDLHLSLAVDEELVIRNKTTDRYERLQFNWDQF
jgi:hypothetical protein